MINLLPPQEKRRILREEKYRLMLILGAIVLFFLISLCLILFSIKIYISGEIEAQKILVEAEEERFEISKLQDLEKEINLMNENFSKLTSFYENQYSFSGFFLKISELLPSGIYLTNLSLGSLSRENKSRVSLAGLASNRTALSEFKKNLETQPFFEEIYFPPSNWVKPEDIDFSATFNIQYAPQ